MKTINYIQLMIASLLLFSCKNGDNEFDATGSFEAIETIISAEANGRLESFEVQEGQEVSKGQTIGWIDTVQLYLQKKRLNAQIEAILSRKPDISVQLEALNQQLTSAKKEEARVKKLLESDAATTKQLDDIQAQINVLSAQIKASKSGMVTTSTSLDKEVAPLRVQMEQLDDQINKSMLIAPMDGTILSTYVQPYEMVGTGKPLYKLASLATMTLKVYITGDQLPQVKLNQTVTVLTDDGNGRYRETQGKISWISSQAEFTPKTVQTKDERANKVYAMKVRVPNDGTYKIGMYGQVNFQ
jgi:HlyD family secretion protein